MSTGILGDTIDIHGGGADLEFPHQRNEIAQSEAKTNLPTAELHNSVSIDNVKMSKSLRATLSPCMMHWDYRRPEYFASSLRLTLPAPTIIQKKRCAMQKPQVFEKYLWATVHRRSGSSRLTKSLCGQFIAAMDRRSINAGEHHCRSLFMDQFKVIKTSRMPWPRC